MIPNKISFFGGYQKSQSRFFFADWKTKKFNIDSLGK